MLVQIFVKNKIRGLLLGALLMSSLPVVAQDLEESPAEASASSASAKVTSKGRTLYLEFGNELIDGTGGKPSVEYLFTRSQFNYKRLIRLRENFQPEVKQGRGDFSGSGR